MKIKKQVCLVVAILLVCSCIKSPSRYNWDVISAGDGVWNIDELRVTEIYPSSQSIVEDTTFYNYGTITFSGTKDAPEYQMEKLIDFDTYDLGPISGPLEVFGSDMIFRLGNGTGLSSSFIDAEIVKIKKKEIILFCPWTLNTIADGINDVDFYFRLSKK